MKFSDLISKKLIFAACCLVALTVALVTGEMSSESFSEMLKYVVVAYLGSQTAVEVTAKIKGEAK